MARFAKIQVDINTVIDVLIADQSYVDALCAADNTKNPTYNYIESDTLGIGFVYDSDASAYLGPKPHASWVLSDTTIGSVREWVPPIARPMHLLIGMNRKQLGFIGMTKQKIG